MLFHFRVRDQGSELCVWAYDVIIVFVWAADVICVYWPESNSDRFEMNIMNRECQLSYWQHGTEYVYCACVHNT